MFQNPSFLSCITCVNHVVQLYMTNVYVHEKVMYLGVHDKLMYYMSYARKMHNTFGNLRK